MELVETWDNIWRWNGKDNGKIIDNIHSLSQPPELCLGCRCPSKPRLEFLITTSTHVCVFSLSLLPEQRHFWLLDVTVTESMHLFFMVIINHLWTFFFPFRLQTRHRSQVSTGKNRFRLINSGNYSTFAWSWKSLECGLLVLRRKGLIVLLKNNRINTFSQTAQL